MFYKSFFHGQCGNYIWWDDEYDFKKYNQIKNPFLKAILLGKEAICKERKIEFIFDSKSNFELKPKKFFIEDLSTIIGNLIENSIESFIDYNIDNKFIKIQIFKMFTIYI